MTEETKIVTSTELVDMTPVEDILVELHNVLLRRGCALVHMPDGMMLCKITGLNEGLALALVSEIKPGGAKFRRATFGSTFQRKAIQ